MTHSNSNNRLPLVMAVFLFWFLLWAPLLVGTYFLFANVDMGLAANWVGIVCALLLLVWLVPSNYLARNLVLAWSEKVGVQTIRPFAYGGCLLVGGGVLTFVWLVVKALWFL